MQYELRSICGFYGVHLDGLFSDTRVSACDDEDATSQVGHVFAVPRRRFSREKLGEAHVGKKRQRVSVWL